MYELPRGSAVGKYEIMRRLALGGMAEIYLARVTGAAGFEKMVVLKRILPSVAEDPTFVNMFLDEARLAATLRHPNIADVYDVGEDDGTYFFTMEYVYGQDVRTIRHDARKRNEPIPLAVSLAIVHGAASALDHAHEKRGADGKPLDLVHRDVSASNIMVSYDGAVKLLDFGIARAASSTHKTQTGTLKGKIPYMSPEQCKGLPLDRRSDLFSLGTVLYELTVGKRPFRGETDFAVMDQIVYQGTKRPSEVVSGYPPELEAIVMKLLERAPSMRYATGEDVLHDLDAFVAKHGLWLSPRAIGKYMRELFADKIAAWEQAEQEGVPFAQYVAQTITSQSQRSELLTPPSEFPGLPPRSTSQRMKAQADPGSQQMAAAPDPPTPGPMDAVHAPLGRRTSKPMPAMQPLVPVTPAPLPPQSGAPDSAPFARQSLEPDSASFARKSPEHDSAPFLRNEPDSGSFVRRSLEPESGISVAVYPSLKPRSSKTIMLAFLGSLVLGAGGVFGYMLNNADKPAAAAAEPADPPPTQMIEAPAVPTTPAAVAPAIEAKPAAPAPAAPAPTPPVAAAPASPTVPVVDTEPTVPEPTHAAMQPVAAKPAAAKPAATKPAVKKPIVRKPPARPTKQSSTKQPEEPTWDPNSPFLPQ